jgi:phosphoglycolate phosphatase-like HAD superfamily hydrolase
VADLLASVIEDHGGECGVEACYEMQNRLEESFGPYHLVFDDIAKQFDLGIEFVETCRDTYEKAPMPEEISLLPGVKDTLLSLRTQGYRTFLLTTGTARRQEEKIRKSGLRCGSDPSCHLDAKRVAGSRLPQLEQEFLALLREFDLGTDEVLWVGDRIREEIRLGNELGALTAQMLHGHYQGAVPRLALEMADYRIGRISQIPTLLRLWEKGKPPEELRIVAVGGGTGLPIVLEGLKTYSKNLTAVVSVTDTGRSSEQVRNGGLLSPGDIKNVLVALASSAADQQVLARLFRHRFHPGDGSDPFYGMSLGNLIIAALAQINNGSFKRAVEQASQILHIDGKVFPATLTNVHVGAKLEDGSKRVGECQVRSPGKPPIDLGVRWEACDVLGTAGEIAWEKEAYLRHDPYQAADAVCRAYCDMR